MEQQTPEQLAALSQALGYLHSALQGLTYAGDVLRRVQHERQGETERALAAVQALEQGLHREQREGMVAQPAGVSETIVHAPPPEPAKPEKPSRREDDADRGIRR
ncbi:MAG: hypothetical protein ABWY63_14325 [Hyphomicrobiaceae bacterium]